MSAADIRSLALRMNDERLEIVEKILDLNWHVMPDICVRSVHGKSMYHWLRPNMAMVADTQPPTGSLQL
jgi:hypothetical protein